MTEVTGSDHNPGSDIPDTSERHAPAADDKSIVTSRQKVEKAGELRDPTPEVSMTTKQQYTVRWTRDDGSAEYGVLTFDDLEDAKNEVEEHKRFGRIDAHIMTRTVTIIDWVRYTDYV